MASRPVETLDRYSVTVLEAAAITGISKDVLYANIHSGKLPAGRPSKALVIVLTDLYEFVEESKNWRDDA